MSILIVCSTELEIDKSKLYQNFKNNGQIAKSLSFFISGVGIFETTFKLTRFLTENSNFQKIINIGFCGSYTKNLAAGELVNVVNDNLPEFGVLYSISKILPLPYFEHQSPKTPKYPIKSIESQISNLKKVNGLTVLSCTNNSFRKKYFMTKYQADIETMEGFACQEICNYFEKEFIQIRCVSNYIPYKNKNNWHIELAKTNIANFIDNLSI